MSKVIMVTSFKGGVGKTSVSANLSMGLALSGAKTLAIDCDLESRCLDIALSLENESLFNICDVLNGVCGCKDALVRDNRCENLYFLSAPPSFLLSDNEEAAKELFSYKAIEKLIEDLCDFEYIILDLPARPDRFYVNLIAFADMALVVSLHNAISVRAAEKTSVYLKELSEQSDFHSEKELEIRLVINGFYPKDAINGKRPKISEVINGTSIRLIAVLPFDKAMADGQENGLLAYQISQKNPFYRAVDNLCQRIEGEKIPLLSKVKTGVKRENLF